MTRFFKNFTAAFAVTLTVVATLDAFQTIDQRHAEQRIELERALQEQAEAEAYPTAEEIHAALPGVPSYTFPDPCDSEFVSCEGEPGWEE